MTVSPLDVWLREHDEAYEMRTLPPPLRNALTSLMDHIFQAATEAYDYYAADPTWSRRDELGTVVRGGSKHGGRGMIRDPKAFWLVRSQVPRRLDAIVQEIRRTMGTEG